MFYAIEVGIRRHLNMANIDDMDNSFRSRLVNDLVDDPDVQFSWCIMGYDMDEECNTECLEMIVNKWVTIRGFSFAKCMVELYKQESKKSTQKSKRFKEAPCGFTRASSPIYNSLYFKNHKFNINYN